MEGMPVLAEHIGPGSVQAVNPPQGALRLGLLYPFWVRKQVQNFLPKHTQLGGEGWVLVLLYFIVQVIGISGWALGNC